MKLEFEVPAIAAALFAALVWLAAGAARWARGPRAQPEALAFLRLVWPLVAGGLAVAFVAGWALQESDPSDEFISASIMVVALGAGLVALRAASRAWIALRRASHLQPPIATVGLLRCRTTVSEAFRSSAAPEVLAAALAHEAAHATGRDPLRILFAGVAADLQWPVPGARARLKDWHHALEVRRDDEAVASGASPSALAESIVLAARLTGGVGAVGAAVTGDGSGIALRVRRLLARQQTGPLASERSSSRVWVAVTVAALVAVWAGYCFGDPLLTLLPGVGR
ncbi:MAG TPA: hypothetical protein VGK67_40790 [Myxococcales bacterium]|jgi:hypothetical protein